MKRRSFFSTSTFRYALSGILLGLLFPILGMILYALLEHVSLSIETLMKIQQSQSMLWIIDTAPLFLGLTLGIAGNRQDNLHQIKANLERIVSDRIAELKGVNQDLEKEIEARTQSETQLKASAEELQLIAVVSHGMSLEQDEDKLLPLITRLVSENFGVYHVGIFLLDKNKKFVVLKAANSLEGQKMLEHGHKLEAGHEGIVGYVASTGVMHVAAKVGEDDVFFNNPGLPETCSEIAFPLDVRKQVIGVIDIQSKNPNAFPPLRMKTLAVLADQIAIAIENSRLFTENQRALADAQSFSSQLSAQAWNRVSYEHHIGVLRTMSGEKRLTETVAWEEADRAVRNGETVILPADKKNNLEPALAIPLRVRDQIIGVLDLRSTDPDRSWQEEEINIIQAIADRVGLALENARLFEETTGRANRERAVSEITNRIRSTIDPGEMLQTAIGELKQALGASNIKIRPYHPPSGDGESGQEELPGSQAPAEPTETA